MAAADLTWEDNKISIDADEYKNINIKGLHIFVNLTKADENAHKPTHACQLHISIYVYIYIYNQPTSLPFISSFTKMSSYHQGPSPRILFSFRCLQAVEENRIWV